MQMYQKKRQNSNYLRKPETQTETGLIKTKSQKIKEKINGKISWGRLTP